MFTEEPATTMKTGVGVEEEVLNAEFEAVPVALTADNADPDVIGPVGTAPRTTIFTLRSEVTPETTCWIVTVTTPDG